MVQMILKQETSRIKLKSSEIIAPRQVICGAVRCPDRLAELFQLIRLCGG
jgi:hypothetical protein